MITTTTTCIQSHTPIAIIRVAERLDTSNYLELIAAAQELYRAGTQNIILDMGDIGHIGSAGLVAIHSVALLLGGRTPLDPEMGWSALHAIAEERCDVFHKRFKLLGPQPQVAWTLVRAGFTAFLEVYADRTAAVASFTALTEEGAQARRRMRKLKTLDLILLAGQPCSM
jgi:anti-anti-sigma regulatory factor